MSERRFWLAIGFLVFALVFAIVFAVEAASLTLPYIGELGWADDTHKTCLYKLRDSPRIYFVVVPTEQTCPKQVEIHTDDPESTNETRQARNAF